MWIQIDEYLRSLGLVSAPNDICIFTKGSSIMLGLYVDDIIVAAENVTGIMTLQEDLRKRYRIKFENDIHYILGIKVERDRENRTMLLTQTAYIDRVLQRFGMTECKPAPTPCTATPLIARAHENEEETSFPFREAIGSIMYAMTCTRPDIAFAVGAIARHVSAPPRCTSRP